MNMNYFSVSGFLPSNIQQMLVKVVKQQKDHLGKAKLQNTQSIIIEYAVRAYTAVSRDTTTFM